MQQKAPITLALIFLGLLSVAQKPNVVLIMADDIGLGDIGFYHNERTGGEPVIPTPNIDRLIAEGMRFSDAHSPASLCAPTRFSMLTGNLPFRNAERPWGVWNPQTEAGIDENGYTTIARIAKEGGYNTAFFGKWGLGGVWNGKPKEKSGYEKMDDGARSFGFDYALELPQGIQNEPFAFYENGEWLKLNRKSELVDITFEQTKYVEKERGKNKEGIGDSFWDPALAGPILAKGAVDYIKRQKDDQPFFLYYCSQAVHVPHTPTAKLDNQSVANTTPNTHGDMVKELDVQVGMIIKALKSIGQYQNTLFVFTSDNGGITQYNAEGHDSSNGLTGHKASIYEGGHRVPFIAVWPGKIPPGTTSDQLIVTHDMVATLAEVAEVDVSGETILDAANLEPILTGKSQKPVHQYVLHKSQAAGGPYYALRAGDWKLVMKTKKREDFDNLEVIGLYNLKQNPKELSENNLVKDADQKERIETMMTTYKELRLGSSTTLF